MAQVDGSGTPTAETDRPRRHPLHAEARKSYATASCSRLRGVYSTLARLSGHTIFRTSRMT
jgi:hypothetical protein